MRKLHVIAHILACFILFTSCQNPIGTSTLVSADEQITPSVLITSAPDINQLNLTSYRVFGTCTESGETVNILVGSISAVVNCTGSSWSTGFLDVTSLASGAITIEVSHAIAPNTSININKDLASDSVTLSSAPDINATNETAYFLSGACSSNASNVAINIGGIIINSTCSANTWSSGAVDVQALADGNVLIQVSHLTAPAQTQTVAKSSLSPAVDLLSVATTLSDSANLNWELSSPGGFVINDYIINYRLKGSSTWLVFNDGVGINTFAQVTGLVASSVYEFQVRVQYDTVSFSDFSTIAEGETQPMNTIFGPNTAMNVGGSTDTTVTAFFDNTNITLNGVALITLNRGQVHRFTSSQFDIIDADKAIFTAGRRGSNSSVGASANISWNPTKWAGRTFSFNATRTNPQVLEVFAIEDATITVKQGSTILDSATITSGNGATLSWSVFGSYQVESSANILAFHMSTGGGNLHDPKPLIPGFQEIIGFPSSSMRLTTILDNSNYNLIHSNSTTASGSLNKSQVIQVNPQGTSSLYRGESLLIRSDQKISGASFADSNGLCAASFLSTNLMTRKHIIPVNSAYIAFASKGVGSIQVLDSADNIVTTLNLSRSGANPNAPYRVRMDNPLAGYRFISTTAVGAWYEPNTFNGASNDDETLLYGTND